MIHSNILLHKVCGEEIFMITWIIAEIVVPLLLVVLLLLNMVKKSGNDFVNSIIFRTFEDRNN